MNIPFVSWLLFLLFIAILRFFQQSDFGWGWGCQNTKNNSSCILNRVDSNRLFLNESTPIRFGGKIRLWVLSGNHVLLSKFYDIRKKEAYHTIPGWQVPRRAQMRATAYIVVCSPTTTSVFFLRHGIGSYQSQLLLSGRRKLLNATHGTAKAMQISKSWAFSRVLGRSLASRRAWPPTYRLKYRLKSVSWLVG